MTWEVNDVGFWTDDGASNSNSQIGPSLAHSVDGVVFPPSLPLPLCPLNELLRRRRCAFTLNGGCTLTLEKSGLLDVKMTGKSYQ